MHNVIDKCLSRSNTYGFLSQLYSLGPVPEIHSYIKAIPELALAFAPKDDSGSKQTVTQDDLAADHYQIFGLNVLPYESSFLEIDNVLDGPVTERVLVDYWKSGFHPDTKSESADHIGLELKFLGYLCCMQAEGERDQRVDVASSMEVEQTSFLENHLLRWLPGFVQAVNQHNLPFYTSLVDITLDMVIDHYQDLSHRRLRPPDVEFKHFDLPVLTDLLKDEKTGLKDIANYLLTPAYSGVYLSRQIIEGVAKTQNLPRGFGDRETMLTNLLRNAADYDQLPSLLDDFKLIFSHWMAFYDDLPERYKNPDLLKPYLTPWQTRIENSQIILNHIRSKSANNQLD